MSSDTHVGQLAVEFHQLGHIEFWRLDNLGFANVDILERVNCASRLLDLAANGLGEELLDEFLEIARRRFTVHDLEHLLPDLPNLRRLRVGGLLHLGVPPLGESNGEQPENVAVGRLHINVSLDQRLPLLDERAELVGGEVHAIEIGEAVLALHFVNA